MTGSTVMNCLSDMEMLYDTMSLPLLGGGRHHNWTLVGPACHLMLMTVPGLEGGVKHEVAGEYGPVPVLFIA